MAGISGLLGALSGPSGGYASLLDEEELAQARRSAQADALLNLSSSLFKAGAPSQKRAAEIQGLIGGAYQPAQAAQQPAMIGGAPYGMETPATPAKFDLQAIAPKLMALGPEGYSALNDLMNAQKAMRPEMFICWDV
jgi:hypothetical protein